MITRLQLKNFKCFEQMEMELKNVNVFTGVNGMGKSTVLQALLLLQQSRLMNTGNSRLYLNGKYIRLGVSQDVLYDKASDNEVQINYRLSDQKWYQNHFFYEQDMDYLSGGNEAANDVRLTDGRFIYLSAYRIAPQERYSVINEKELEQCDFGSNGEFAIQYLNKYGDLDVNNCHVMIDNDRGGSLKNQTRLWMNRVSPGVSPQIQVMMENRSSELSFDFVEGKERTNSYKNVNVGFGITYVLPIVIALLTARQGDLVILENPEAHIHPAGQRMLGELIAKAGAGGVQIFVETHSDHILNGIRISVKDKHIEKNDVQIAFFYKDNENKYRHTYMGLQIMEDGKLDHWPKGFFDEWENALIDLL
jgi:predicted ATPase